MYEHKKITIQNLRMILKPWHNKKEISMNNRMEKRNDLHRLVTTDSQITQRKKEINRCDLNICVICLAVVKRVAGIM